MRTQDAGSADEVEIRPAAEGDTDRLRSFLAGLSAQTAYRRFFTGAVPASTRLLTWLLGRDHQREAFVATRGDEIVAHAMYARLPQHDGVAELAVVVADAWQQHGLGPRVVEALLDRARSRGIREVEFTVLADNPPANRLATRSWPQAPPVIDHGVYEYSIPLAERGAA